MSYYIIYILVQLLEDNQGVNKSLWSKELATFLEAAKEMKFTKPRKARFNKLEIFISAEYSQGLKPKNFLSISQPIFNNRLSINLMLIFHTHIDWLVYNQMILKIQNKKKKWNNKTYKMNIISIDNRSTFIFKNRI